MRREAQFVQELSMSIVSEVLLMARYGLKK